jgi:hypothetical protein
VFPRLQSYLLTSYSASTDAALGSIFFREHAHCGGSNPLTGRMKRILLLLAFGSPLFTGPGAGQVLAASLADCRGEGC